MQGEKQGERENRVKKTEDSGCSLLAHFWSTFRSPFCTCYILFQSSGSQESNASNGAWFGVETKKLQPLQVNHSKVLRNHPFVAKWFRSLFVQCCGFPPKVTLYMPQAGSWEPQGGSQFCSPASLTCWCENISQPSWVSVKSRRHHFLLQNGSWSFPIFSTDSFSSDIFVSKFPFSPCIHPLM